MHSLWQLIGICLIYSKICGKQFCFMFPYCYQNRICLYGFLYIKKENEENFFRPTKTKIQFVH